MITQENITLGMEIINSEILDVLSRYSRRLDCVLKIWMRYTLNYNDYRTNKTISLNYFCLVCCFLNLPYLLVSKTRIFSPFNMGENPLLGFKYKAAGEKTGVGGCCGSHSSFSPGSGPEPQLMPNPLPPLPTCRFAFFHPFLPDLPSPTGMRGE